MNDTSRKNIVIICGSKSDFPQVKAVCSDPAIKAKIVIHIASCHRNPEELTEFIFNRLHDGDFVIGVGSKALALPGVIDAWAHCYKKNIRVAGVALGETDSQELIDAQRSIMGLPSQPVIFNEKRNQAYTGPFGLRELIDLIEKGEIPQPKPRKEANAEFDVWSN